MRTFKTFLLLILFVVFSLVSFLLAQSKLELLMYELFWLVSFAVIVKRKLYKLYFVFSGLLIIGSVFLFFFETELGPMAYYIHRFSIFAYYYLLFGVIVSLLINKARKPRL